MSGFDRSKYQKAKVEVIQEIEKKAQSTMTSMGGNGKWAPFYVIKSGENVLRVLPSKSGLPYLPMKTMNLHCEVPVYNESGEKTGSEVKEKKIFCADVHCPQMGGKDPGQIYMKYVMKLAEDIQDENERKKFLYPITGYKGRDNKWVWGMSPMLSYICYVAAEGDVWRLQLRPKWIQDMRAESVRQSEDQALSLDIFSDIDEAFPLVIEESIENKKKVYKVSAGTPATRQSWDDFFKSTEISDSIWEKLESLPTLDSLYKDSYTRKDWDMALDGLSRLDEKHGYAIFQDEAFLDELEHLEKLVPKEDEPEEKEEPQKETRTSRRPATTSPEVKEAFANNAKYPPLIEMKSFLREYIKTEYEDSETLPTDLTIKEVREWYDLAKEGKMLPFPDPEDNDPIDEGQPENDGPEDEEPPVDETKTDRGKSLSDSRARLQAIRDKVNGKK